MAFYSHSDKVKDKEMIEKIKHRNIKLRRELGKLEVIVGRIQKHGEAVSIYEVVADLQDILSEIKQEDDRNEPI